MRIQLTNMILFFRLVSGLTDGQINICKLFIELRQRHNIEKRAKHISVYHFKAIFRLPSLKRIQPREDISDCGLLENDEK